jgi:phosphate starvation-inducible PhoH-like protein
VIEIAPLAYMRGRTLERAFVILDEAQKHDREADADVPPRMGLHSRIVVTGDRHAGRPPLGAEERAAARHPHPRRRRRASASSA